MRNLLFAATIFTAAALFGPAPGARAGYSVQVYDDGVLQDGKNGTGTITVVANGNSLVFLGSTTHFSITNGSGTSNNPGTPSSSSLTLSSNEQITTTFGSAGGTHSIKIVLSQTDFLSPAGSLLTLSSSAGGSYAGTQADNSVAATYQGFLDNSNTLFGTPGAGSTPTISASATAAMSPNGTIPTNPLVFNPGTAVSTVPGGTPFSMTDVLTFTFTIKAGSGQDTANVSASTIAAVPAPTGLVVALTALPVLGLGWLQRRSLRTAKIVV